METREKIKRQILKDYDKLYRLAYSYVHNEADAMDIVQECAYKAIKYSKSMHSDKYISSWIYRIAVNTAIDVIHKRQKEIIGLEDYTVIHEDKYQDFDMMDILDTLNKSERTIIILRFFEDMKLSDIAAVTDENISTIKTRLYRSLKKLKIVMEEEIA